MKKLRPSLNASRAKKLACTVSAAALMLGVSSAATIGLHFQETYCNGSGGPTPGYSGFVVTTTAFGIETNGWENLLPMETGYQGCAGPLSYTLNEVIDTTTSTNGLNPLPNGSLNVTWFGATANSSQFAGYGGIPPSYCLLTPTASEGLPANATGEMEIYSTFLRDGINFGPPGDADNPNQLYYSIDITGLKSLFTNTPFVIELIASSDSMQTLTNVFVIDVNGSITNSVTYPNTPPVADWGGAPWVRGSGGGLSTGSAAFTNTSADHIHIMSNLPQHGGSNPGFDNAGNISGFIITDKPVVTMSPQPVLAGPRDSVQLSAYAIGVPPLSCQWRLGGHPIHGATNLSYSFTNVTLADGGNYDLVVTNVYGATTSQVATVTADLITESPTNEIVYDSNPANPQHDGINMGATWEASDSDGTVTRTGVMSFVGTNTNGITVVGSTNFNVATGTITFWMRSAGVDPNASGLANEGAALFCRPTGGTGQDFLVLQQTGGNLLFQAPQLIANIFQGVANVSDDHWHFVALTFDQSAGGGAAFYVDGAFDSTNANTTSWSWPTAQPLEIAYSSDDVWGDYTGLLNDVRFYNRELTLMKITNIYKTGALVNTSALQMQLSFSAAPGGGCSLSWLEGGAVLQSAPNVNGPFQDVSGAVSPYLIVPTATQQFFRYRYVPQSVVSNPYLM